jgi:Protein of unknown function (DUF3574)
VIFVHRTHDDTRLSIPGLLVGLLLALPMQVAPLLADALLADPLLVRQSRDRACTSGETLARIELVFGMSLPAGGMLTDAEWTAFIDTEVTPRFPDGFTVLTGYGQWRNAAGATTRETSRMLVIWHRPSPNLDNRIEAIRTAYKTRYSQESVLRVDGLSCVSF